MEMNFKTAFLKSDLLTFSWQGCSGLIVAQALDEFDKQKNLLELYRSYFEDEDVSTKFDKKSPIVFYKKMGDNYIAWCQYKNCKWEIIKEDLDIIKKELENYETLKQDYDFLMEHYKELLNESRDEEKELKALEIIKEKKVDTYALMVSNCLESYNQYAKWDNSKLTQEEYDLLKEVLL